MALPVHSQAPPAAVTREVKILATQAGKEWREDILPFWSKYAPDREGKGFIGELSADSTIRKNVPRGSLLVSRILWTYSAAYRRDHDPGHLSMAKAAYVDLETHFLDRQSGGFLWAIDAKGDPLDSRKQIYGQAFAIYSLAEYFRATGHRPALDRAIELFHLVEKHALDTGHGGYLEAFTRDWKRPSGARLSAVGPEFPKSQNTHLHLMEAYTNLLRVWPDEGLRRSQHQLVEVMLTRILQKDGRHLDLFFDTDWTSRSSVVSYGHDIEASWLLTEAAEVLGDPALLIQAKNAALKLAQSTLEEGVDKDGGVFFERDAKGVINTNKDWWPQAEAAVGFLNAFALSGDAKYLAAARRSWEFIQTFVVDHQRGEWFEKLQRDGTPIPGCPKISFWKCPYHNARACMEIESRCAELF